MQRKLLKVLTIAIIAVLLNCYFASEAKAEEKLYYIHSDHLGSTTVVTDEYGKPVSQQSYYPYGETRYKVQTGALPTERQYTGQVSDADQTGLYYYNARYYNPQLAKFTQADIIEGPNRYTYVGNNPIIFIDPSGNTKCIYRSKSRIRVCTEGGVYQESPFKNHIFSGIEFDPYHPKYRDFWKEYLSGAVSTSQGAESQFAEVKMITDYVYHSMQYNPLISATRGNMLKARELESQAIKEIVDLTKKIDNTSGTDRTLLEEELRLKREIFQGEEFQNMLKNLREPYYEALEDMKNYKVLSDAIQANRGMCGQLSLAEQYVLYELGYKTNQLFIDIGIDSHAAVKVYIDGQEYVADPTVNDIMPYDNYLNFYIPYVLGIPFEELNPRVLQAGPFEN